MKSRWAQVKDKVLKARRSGASMNEIEITFGVPKATQNFWFSKIKLSREARATLEQKKTRHLIEARKKAIKWHNAEKSKRVESARLKAEETLSRIDRMDNTALELALAMLYMGEGSKTTSTSLGNSDPLILRFFITAIHRLYSLDVSKMRLDLHLRADQDTDEMIDFWSRELSVSKDQFTKTSKDKRTIGKKTYDGYKGVCIVDCGNVAIQRKLVYLSRAFCSEVTEGTDRNLRG